jgi:hypothetical protein
LDVYSIWIKKGNEWQWHCKRREQGISNTLFSVLHWSSIVLFESEFRLTKIMGCV